MNIAAQKSKNMNKQFLSIFDCKDTYFLTVDYSEVVEYNED